MRGFRVLIVEDDPQALAQIVKLLQEALVGSVIDSAESVKQALAKIEGALSSGEPYDLAILDFKLPQRPGEIDDVDEQVCRKLMASMPDTIVSHISGFAEDTRILGHLARVHPAGRPRGFFLDKRNVSFGIDLAKKTREALYSSRIEREIDDLFASGEEPRPDGLGARSPSPRRAASVSNRLVDLSFDISLVWKDLNAATQSRIQTFFVVNQEPDRISVVKR